MATYYVDWDDGLDTNPGTEAQPFKTITKAISVLVSGAAEEVVLRAGTFQENNIAFSNKGGASWGTKWLFRAYTGELVTIKPTAGNRVLHFQDANTKYIEWQDVHLDADNVSSDGVKITVGATAAHHIRLTRCEVKNATNGLVQGVLITVGSVGCELIDCDVHDNGSNSQGHGVYAQAADLLIQGGHYWNNFGCNIHVWNSAGTGADNCIVERVRAEFVTRGICNILVGAGSGAIVRNNVCIGTTRGVQVHGNAVNADILHNTIVDATETGILLLSGGTGAEVRNNLLWNNAVAINNSASGTVQSNNYTTPNPVFVDEGGGDLHLQASSPAHNTVPRLASVTTDKDGESRDDPTEPGAYEGSGGAPPPSGDADIIIDVALPPTYSGTRWGSARAFLSDTLVYEFFLGNFGNQWLYWRKSTDGGETWADAELFYEPPSNGNIANFAFWCDRWTEGISTTKFHLVWHDGGDFARYSSFDWVTETYGTVYNIVGVAIDGTLVGFDKGSLSVVRLKSGRLRMSSRPPSDHYDSNDEGVTWTLRSGGGDPHEAVAHDFGWLPADGTGDDHDAALIYVDADANELSLKMYDHSGNSLSETVIGSMTPAGADYRNWDAMLSHDGEIKVVWFNLHNNSSADLKAATITPNAHPAPSATAKTDVLTNVQPAVSPRLLLDEVNGDIYCFYLRGGTLGSTMSVYYKVSTDNMSTWSSEQPYSTGSAGPLRNLFTSRLIRAGDSGRIAASWTHETDQDLVTNVDNSIAVTPAVGAGTVPRVMHSYRMRRA